VWVIALAKYRPVFFIRPRRIVKPVGSIKMFFAIYGYLHRVTNRILFFLFNNYVNILNILFQNTSFQ
jgi:hypothetical protein